MIDPSGGFIFFGFRTICSGSTFAFDANWPSIVVITSYPISGLPAAGSIEFDSARILRDARENGRCSYVLCASCRLLLFTGCPDCACHATDWALPPQAIKDSLPTSSLWRQTSSLAGSRFVVGIPACRSDGGMLIAEIVGHVLQWTGS